MILENTLNEEAKTELNKIKKKIEKWQTENLVYRTNEYTDYFKNFEQYTLLVETFTMVKLL